MSVVLLRKCNPAGRGVLVALLSAVLLVVPAARCAATPPVWVRADGFVSAFVQQDGDVNPYDNVFGTEGDYKQGKGGNDLLDHAREWKNSLLNLLKIILGIAALVVLVGVILNLTSGDSGAAKRLGSWFLGFLVGEVLLTVFSRLRAGESSGAKSVTANGTGLLSLRQDIGNVMEVMLLIVAMFTLVTTTVQLMRGEQGSAEKIVRWLVTVSIGIMLLEII